MHTNRFRFTVIVFALSVLAAFLWISLNERELEKDIRAQYLKAGDFTLNSNLGKVSLSDYSGTPVLLYFGYTFCPDVCPVGLAVIRDVLNSDSRLENVQVLFVTLDPRRDNEKKVSDYARFFHKNITGLSGDLAQIKLVSDAYGVSFRSNYSEESNHNYTVDHSAYYYLINTRGDLVRVLDHDAKVEDIAQLLLKML